MKKILLVIALSLAGCATDEHAEERRDATRWDELAHALAATTADHCAAQPWTQASCAEMAAQHDDTARGSVDEIRVMAARMDGMAALVSRDLADASCTGDALLAELDRHAAAGCAGSAEDAEEEARGHCATMLDLTAQMHLRSDVALQAMTTVYYSGTGSMRRPHRTSAGSHDWPWATGEQPAIAAVCPATP
jgi:hypothetical protein